ncbi:MAG: hypothetical protein A2847_03060 [Candidatus Sungbacteria bacterium RIFCSPHIGHO2_01_FULL_50_25]|uniref:Uncharacterized protein n=1 Tax=Candidatus Sungbacteria bacterium RIFCSPHIGHO2_01_FULL_50_25 TaxID=1802265 RepID=A0A1G2K749_9BACT|nr:MAG: hypothetical protein A2847_03060 [Candidatus Sungbacteria bacterium RIFCSPHIGHO2_01_FULL_50_25]
MSDLLIRWNDKIIAVFGLLNIGFVVLGTLLFAAVLLSGDILWRQEYVRFVPQLVISLVIYIGIAYRKSWVLPLIWITLSIGFIQGLLIPIGDAVFLIAKVVGLSIGIFWIYFFNRKQVREYFHYKGITIF